MNRILKIVAIPAALASIALATPAAAEDVTSGTANGAERILQGAATGDLSAVSSVASSTALPELRSHGARFQAAIRLIEAEAQKPGWGWDEDCGHIGSDQSARLNW